MCITNHHVACFNLASTLQSSPPGQPIQLSNLIIIVGKTSVVVKVEVEDAWKL